MASVIVHTIGVGVACDATPRFQARLGTYALVWHRNKVTKAVNYVGLQMSQTVLGFVMFFMVWTPLIFAVQYARWGTRFATSHVMCLVGRAQLTSAPT